MVCVGFHVLCHILPNLTSNMDPSMDLLHAINPQINWHTYSLSLNCGGHSVHILGTL